MLLIKMLKSRPVIPRKYNKPKILLPLVAGVLLLSSFGVVAYKKTAQNDNFSKDNTNQSASSNELNNSTNPTEDSASNSAKPSVDSGVPTNSSYLYIKEWGIKLPLTEFTRSATYDMHESYVGLNVSIEGDTDGACKSQAQIVKIVESPNDPDYVKERNERRKKDAQLVNDTYYYMSGAQSACSSNSDIQEKATEIRKAFLDQARNISAVE